MPVEAIKIQNVWESIRPIIDGIRGDLPWKDFRTEDIYAACANGQAAIFVDTDYPLGDSFFIARIDENNSTGERVLFLWIAHSSAPETAGRVHELIEEIARNSGCSAVEFITGNESVLRYGSLHGFDKVMFRCRKEMQAPPELGLAGMAEADKVVALTNSEEENIASAPTEMVPGKSSAG